MENKIHFNWKLYGHLNEVTAIFLKLVVWAELGDDACVNLKLPGKFLLNKIKHWTEAISVPEKMDSTSWFIVEVVIKQFGHQLVIVEKQPCDTSILSCQRLFTPLIEIKDPNIHISNVDSKLVFRYEDLFLEPNEIPKKQYVLLSYQGTFRWAEESAKDLYTDDTSQNLPEDVFVDYFKVPLRCECGKLCQQHGQPSVHSSPNHSNQSSTSSKTQDSEDASPSFLEMKDGMHARGKRRQKRRRKRKNVDSKIDLQF